MRDKLVIFKIKKNILRHVTPPGLEFHGCLGLRCPGHVLGAPVKVFLKL